MTNIIQSFLFTIQKIDRVYFKKGEGAMNNTEKTIDLRKIAGIQFDPKAKVLTSGVVHERQTRQKSYTAKFS